MRFLNFAVIVSVAGAVPVLTIMGNRIVQRMRARAAENPVRDSSWSELTSAGAADGR